MASVRSLSFDVGTKNLAACDLTVDADGSFEVHSWHVSSCVPRGVNVNKTPLAELAPIFSKWVSEGLVDWLYEPLTDPAAIVPGSITRPGPRGSTVRLRPKPIDRVFIENQPMGGRGAARNLKTKVLSHILQCHLLAARPELQVTFVHPGLKLKDMPRKEDGSRSSYRENKQYAISKATEYVTGASCRTLEVCQQLYVTKKLKKDDLADAFLQGLLAGLMYARGDVLEPAEDKPKKTKKADASEAANGSDVATKPKKAIGVKRVRAAAAVEATIAVEAPAVEVAPAEVPVADADKGAAETPKKRVKSTKNK